MNKKENLTALRCLMQNKGIDAYIVPCSDSHSSEYFSDYWNSLKWITGFTGSYGTFVITSDKAGLWTDGRYTIQAKLELEGSNIELFNTSDGSSYLTFLSDNLPENGTLGFDGRVISLGLLKYFKDSFDSKNISYIFKDDLIGELWQDRPTLSTKPAFVHDLCFAGKSSLDKLTDIRAKMNEKNITAYLVSALDDIAWLLNIRGYDLPYTPVVYAYVLITEEDAFVFIDPTTASNVSDTLTSQGFTLFGYNDLPQHLSSIQTEYLYFNPYITNVIVAESIPSNNKIKTEYADEYYKDIIMFMKYTKTKEEQENVKNAFINESAMLVKTLKWLDDEISKVSIGSELHLKEGDVARVIDKNRSELPNYICESFSTIVAYGANAAQTHYEPKNKGETLIREGFLLIDTGGQYLNGTTDTSRTIALGELTEEMKRDYTLVLKSHIALASAEFKTGERGQRLDGIARSPLWQAGEDFSHSTGHGIGYCLNVHESPISISDYSSKFPLRINPGSMVSNEPGIYKEGKYGIRIENIYLVVEKQKTASGTFDCFECLTYCPIDLRAVETSMLTNVELDWLNNYHQRTCEILKPYLTEVEYTWLCNVTKAI